LGGGVGGVVTVDEVGGGESGAGHFQFAHDDAEDLFEDFVFVDGGVDLAGSLKERLEARYLLLQVDCFSTARQVYTSGHRVLRGISL
jgi:hypothetical protein